MLTYRQVRRIVLIAMLSSLAAMIIAWYLTGTPVLRQVLVWFGCIVFAAALAVVFIGFRCPACGAHFFQNALFLTQCPVCGLRFMDFELGKKLPLPPEFDPDATDSKERLPDR